MALLFRSGSYSNKNVSDKVLQIYCNMDYKPFIYYFKICDICYMLCIHLLLKCAFNIKKINNYITTISSLKHLLLIQFIIFSIILYATVLK